MNLKTCIHEQKSSVNAVAEICGVTQSAVSQWLTSGSVPAKHCPTIEKFFDGAIRCEQLNASVDWAYLRESSQPA